MIKPCSLNNFDLIYEEKKKRSNVEECLTKGTRQNKLESNNALLQDKPTFLAKWIVAKSLGLWALRAAMLKRGLNN